MLRTLWPTLFFHMFFFQMGVWIVCNFACSTYFHSRLCGSLCIGTTDSKWEKNKKEKFRLNLFTNCGGHKPRFKAQPPKQWLKEGRGLIGRVVVWWNDTEQPEVWGIARLSLREYVDIGIQSEIGQLAGKKKLVVKLSPVCLRNWCEPWRARWKDLCWNMLKWSVEDQVVLWELLFLSFLPVPFFIFYGLSSEQERHSVLRPQEMAGYLKASLRGAESTHGWPRLIAPICALNLDQIMCWSHDDHMCLNVFECAHSCIMPISLDWHCLTESMYRSPMLGTRLCSNPESVSKSVQLSDGSLDI